MKAHTRESQSTMTPERSLLFLREGNQRFMQNLMAHRSLLDMVNETREGQWPFATILSCMDSRTSAELIFDQGLGDIFSIRIAGNVVSEDVLGSLEFSAAVAGSRLLVVLGHSGCGAIKGACDNVQLGNLSSLLSKVQPSVFFERTVTKDRTSHNPEFVERVAELHVRRSVQEVIVRSVVVRELVEAGRVGLIGGMYSVDTGRVRFMDDTWRCGVGSTHGAEAAPAVPPHHRVVTNGGGNAVLTADKSPLG